MPLLQGTAVVGGDMPTDLRQKSQSVASRFDEIVQELAEERNLRRAEVRSQLVNHAIVIADKDTVWFVCEATLGMPEIHFFDRPQLTLSRDDARESGNLDFGLREPYVVGIPRNVLDMAEDQADEILRSGALAWIESEVNRFVLMSNMIQISPIFGPAAFRQEPGLCFVIMPFADDLTKIYQEIIKPCVEAHGLACRRADDLRTNRAIMDDIWKSICEARLVIADLTQGNPNVFYELGIAHTVGKDTILIWQRQQPEKKRPFDIFHLRTIAYDDNATGGQYLRRELDVTIDAMLRPIVPNVAPPR